jgi:hypothetical protein
MKLFATVNIKSKDSTQRKLEICRNHSLFSAPAPWF